MAFTALARDLLGGTAPTPCNAFAVQRDGGECAVRYGGKYSARFGDTTIFVGRHLSLVTVADVQYVGFTLVMIVVVDIQCGEGVP